MNRALGIGSLICTLVFALHGQVAQGAGWDPGVPSRLFKDGQTNDKKPKPTHRLAPAPEKCPDCQALVDQLQAALDDWYAMQYADGEKNRKEAGFADDAASNDKRDKAVAQMADALAGLGQPADNGKAAQAKQKANAKDPKLKDSRGNKDALAKEIKRLLDLLQACLDKCAEPEKKPIIEKPGGGTSPTGGGGEKEGPTDGEQPGTGGVKKGGVQPLPTLPTLPECWKGDAKKKFEEDLDAAEKELLKQRAYYGPHGGFTGKEEDREPAAKKVNDALKKINDLKEAAKDVKNCPTGMAQPQKTPTENVGLPGGTGDTLAMLVSRGSIKIDNEGTGETIGHIADLKIQNLTDQPIMCVIPPMILESISGKNQHYACPKGQTVRLDPHSTATVPMDGVCLVRNKPPVGKGMKGDLLVNEGNPEIPQHGDSHIPAKTANNFLHICTSKYDAARKLEDDGLLKDLPYRDKQKRMDIVVQWSTWMDPRISELTGAPPATKEDLKKVVYKQIEEKGPMKPETKKKVDQGIDTIFEKIELTTEKAKDLEKPEEGGTIDGGVPPVVNQPQTVGMPTPTPEARTTERPATTPPPPLPTTTERPTATPTASVPPTTGKPTPTPSPAVAKTGGKYPFVKETDCGTIKISVGKSGELVFDFTPKNDPKCPCKEFGWIQHISNSDQEAWRYDNGVLSAVGKRTGAKSDPDKPNQPTTPPKGTKLEDWDNNPWYGGTTDETKDPNEFGEHPTPQTHVSDKPNAPKLKFKMQLVCVATGQVLFTWEWGPFITGSEAVDKAGGKSVPPP